MSNTTVSLFGDFSIKNQTSVESVGSKTKCLVAYLALQPEIPVLRTTLANVFWPDVSEAQGRHYVTRDLKPVRDILQKQLVISREKICLKADGLYVDANAMDRARKIGTSDLLRKALEILDRGIFLPGCRGAWVNGKRQHYLDAHLDILKSLVAIYTHEGSHDSVLSLLRRCIILLPDHAEPHLDLISYLLDCGNLVDANAEYQNLVRRLQKSNLPHSPAIKEIEIRLRTARKPPTQSTLGDSTTDLPHRRLKNAPIQRTSFIGRMDILTDIIGHLSGESPARVITLTGVAGVGKTRLSLEAADSVIASFPDGGWFFDLRPIRDAKFLNTYLLEVIGIEAKNDVPPLKILVNHLRDKKSLFVLDNCEHLASHCRQLITNLVNTCAELQILVTTRQALGMKDEREITVPPLALPNLALPIGEVTDVMVQVIAQFESVKFFVARATEVRSDFALIPNNVTRVLEICRNLDNLPFAIELLATWARHDELSELLERSKRPMNFMGDALRLMLHWDEANLSDIDRTLLFSIAISYDGLSLPAAEFIVDAVLGDPSADIVHSYHSLRNRFLIEITKLPDEKLHATVLEAVRAFALEKLQESPIATNLYGKRVHYLSTLVSSQIENVGTPRQAKALETISAEANNIRAALEWCLRTSEEFDVGLSLARDMYGYWRIGGFFVEGYDWAVSFGYHAASKTPERKKLRAQVVNAAGAFAYLKNNLEGAQMHFEEALELQADVDDMAGVAGTLGNLATLADVSGDDARALELQHESRRLHDSLNLPRKAATNVSNIGGIEFRRKRYVEAQAIWETLLPISDQLDDPELRQLLLNNLGSVTFYLGNMAMSWKYYCDALVLSRGMKDVPVMTRCCENMSEVLCRWEAWPLAIQLLGAADAWRERSGFVRQSDEKNIITDLIQQMKIAVGVSSYEQWYAGGRTLSIEAATDKALAWHLDDQPETTFRATSQELM